MTFTAFSDGLYISAMGYTPQTITSSIFAFNQPLHRGHNKMSYSTLSVAAVAIMLASLSHDVAVSPPPLFGHVGTSNTSDEADETPARYLSQGPFDDDPSDSDSLSASPGLTNGHHYQQPLYRIDSVEDNNQMNGPVRVEAAKLEECRREMGVLIKVCYTSLQLYLASSSLKFSRSRKLTDDY